MDKKIELHLPTAPGQPATLVLREGKAPDLLPPGHLKYNGRLDTPRLFIEGKQDCYAPKGCTLVVDTENLSVALYAAEKDQDSNDVLRGSLVVSAVLDEFTINKTTRWTVPNLIELVKRNRPYFATRDEHMALLKNLRTWNVAVTKVYQDEKDEKQGGNARQSLETRVEGINLPNFTLFVPVFKGYPREAVEVEFGVDASGSGVLLYLDSPQLLDRVLAYSEELIAAEASYFRELFGCSVIYIS